MEGIEIIDFQPEGYKPLVDYESWRVAVLKFCDDLLIENVKTMQKHLYTDEVFVLVQGHCTLFLAGEGDKPGTWHNHIMDTDGEVVIVENRDTCDDNSPILPLGKNQLVELANAAK